MDDIDQPTNPTDRYLYGVNVRLDALCNMLSSFLGVYAKQHELTVTENKVEEDVIKPTRTSKKKRGE